MRDLLSKLDAIVSETELKNPEDLQAKRRALADLEKDPVASDDPEISSAITQRKSDLEKEAKAKGFAIADHSLSIYANCTKDKCPNRSDTPIRHHHA